MRQVFVVMALAVALTVTLTAKGPTVRLEITGAALARPITVTDQNILSDSNVFVGDFLGPIASPTVIDPTWPKYVVSFFVELPAWMHEGVQKKYVVYYAKNPQTGRGFVYLPAPGEEWYHLNVSTILRNGLEGNWLDASGRWSKTLNSYLP